MDPPQSGEAEETRKKARKRRTRQRDREEDRHRHQEPPSLGGRGAGTALPRVRYDGARSPERARHCGDESTTAAGTAPAATHHMGPFKMAKVMFNVHLPAPSSIRRYASTAGSLRSPGGSRRLGARICLSRTHWRSIGAGPRGALRV